MSFRFLALALLCLTSFAMGNDRRYGSDGLPFLASQSLLIVETAGLQEQSTASTWERLYRAPVSGTLKGSPVSDTITVALSRSSQSSGGRALLFLGEPLTERARAMEGIEAQGTIYTTLGEVPLDGGRVETAIREFVALKLKPAGETVAVELLAWSARYLSDETELLRRSAFLQLESMHRPEVRKIVLEALHSGDPSSSRQDLVRLLASFADAETFAFLVHFSEDTNQNFSSRRAAVEAVAGYPEGATKLREWTHGSDESLALWAKDTYDTSGLRYGDPSEKAAILAEIRNELRFPDGQERLAALRKIVRLAARLPSASAEAKALLDTVASPSAFAAQSPVFKSAILDTLYFFKDQPTVRRLSDIASDRNETLSVRKSALYSLARMRTLEAANALTELSSTLETEPLRKSAKGARSLMSIPSH